MAFMLKPLGPDGAADWYPGQHDYWKELALEADKYLAYLRAEQANGPPAVDSTLGLNAEKLNAGWASTIERNLAEAEEMVAGYAALLKEVG